MGITIVGSEKIGANMTKCLGQGRHCVIISDLNQEA
jgi:hypothetical protein